MAAPRLSFSNARLVLLHPIRWRMLAELVTGEPRTNQDFAKLFRADMSTISKHLNILRNCGVVEVKHRVNYLAERFRPAPGSTEIDFGGVVLRLGDAKWLET
jgi:DNA-binding transcriptional ArsR family regulator